MIDPFGLMKKKPSQNPVSKPVQEQPVPLDAITGKGMEQISLDTLPKTTDESISANDMQESILSLCRLLSKKTSDGKFEEEPWVRQLDVYLSKAPGRLMYSAISNYIFNKNEEELTTFETNLDFALHYVEAENAKNPDDEKWKRRFKEVLKFYDHSNLAIQQQKLVNKKRVDLEHEVAEILSPKVADLTKDMTSQLVSMVGIFTALSFIVFGGISSLDSIFGAARGTLKDQGTILPVLIIAVAWALCMMNLLFGFMYFVIRITRLPKPVNEDAKNIVQRYPTVFLCNYVLLALLVLFSGMWFAEQNGIGKKTFEAIVGNNSEWTFWIAIILYGAFFVVLGWRLWRHYKPKPRNENKTE